MREIFQSSKYRRARSTALRETIERTMHEKAEHLIVSS